MQRRNYIKTVGCIALTTQAGIGATEKVRASAHRDEKVREDGDRDGGRTPVYYTISIPDIEQQILHINIPTDTLKQMNLLRAKSESKTVGINLAHQDTVDEPWELLNLSVQTEHLEEVVLGEVDEETITATRWDELTMEQIGLLTTGTATHGYLGVVGDGEGVHVNAPENSWKFESCKYERVRVETTDPQDIDVDTITNGVRAQIPIFKMDATYLSSS